jgi:alpha-L-fucosidase
VTPQEDAGLMQLDQAQLRELMTNYGTVDIVFLDGPAEGLREVAWDLQPDTVVTRGAIDTPEQRLLGVPLDRAWEACVTMGTEWPYKPANETYKSGTQLIEMLIETRAKGGNLLLNVGPKPDGELPIEQEERLRHIALWNFVNGEAIHAVRPWVVANEGDVWFTRRKDGRTLYAFVTRTPWTLGERKSFTLRSVRATAETRVTVLGQTGDMLEYRPDVDARTTWKQDDKGLHISAMMAQRLYTDRKWVDPVVLQITHVEPGLKPPVVVTGKGTRQDGGDTATLHAELRDLGQAESVEVAFQYRRRKGVEELYTPDDAWTETARLRRAAPGAYRVEVKGLRPAQAYDFRAMVVHPLLTVYGEDAMLEALPPANR